MALVTIQRSPSSSNSSSTISYSETDDDSEDILKKSCSSFFAVKGAAVFLPRGTESRPIKKNPVVGDLQRHLQSMFMLLRPEDSITLVVRLESDFHNQRIRYLVLVSCMGVQDTEENIVLGVDISKKMASIGLVVPVWADTLITLSGDGGFMIKAENRIHIFKPVSVQAMWSCLQALNKSCSNARRSNYFSGGLNLTWTGYYESRVLSKPELVKEWNILPDINSHETFEHKIHRKGELYKPSAKELTERLIVVKLREVLLTVDIEEVTCKQVRTKLEQAVGNDLKEFKSFIDEEMIIILRQMDSPSKIFDFLYLGSEWNAGNLVELEQNGIGYVLNVTKEIDNFFPVRFKYHNIRLYDVEGSDLLKHWEETYRFIAKAKEAGSKVLVHCKMGISRSAATTIAFAMKEYRWKLEEAMKYVKEKRNVINPNKGFRKQLEEYQGILDASNQRNNKLWRSKSESSLSTASSADMHMCADINFGDIQPGDLQPSTTEDSKFLPEVDPRVDPRRRSWSPNDNTAEDLLSDPGDGAQAGVTSPMYLDSPTARYAGTGMPIPDTDGLQDIQFVVPEVPTSPTRTLDQLPPKGIVSQKILSIEGVTTSESTEHSEKTRQEEIPANEAEMDMIPAESPGKFVIEGATSESTEDDSAQESTKDTELTPRNSQVDPGLDDSTHDDEEEMVEFRPTGVADRLKDCEEDRKTPVNMPLFLPFGESGFPCIRDSDVASITSSVAVLIDEDDDYMKKAHLEDDDIEDVEMTSDVPCGGITTAQDMEQSPEDVIEGASSATQEESSETVDISESENKDGATSEEHVDVPEVPQDAEETSLPTSEQLHLDLDDIQTELNTNNNSSNENSPRGVVVASPEKYAKDYPKGSVKTRALCYETQISGDSEVEQGPSVEKPPKSDKLDSPRDSTQMSSDSISIGAVLRQKRDIEDRLKSESESEGSPPSTRSSRFFDSPPAARSSQVFDEDQGKTPVETESELSPPPSDGPVVVPSPSLQALEKGIVKKLTKQLLSSEPTPTKDNTDIKTVESVEPSLSANSTNSANIVNIIDDKTGSLKPDNDRDSISDKPKDECLDKSSSPVKASSELDSEETGATGEDKEVTYSRFGDEKIPLEPGLVKRHTKDYEERKKLKEEVEMMEKMSTPDGSPAVEMESVKEEFQEPVSKSPIEEPHSSEESARVAYPDEGSSWRVGDVRKHKQVFEKDRREKKLSAEELQNIKELEKIDFGRGDEMSDDDEEVKAEVEEEEVKDKVDTKDDEDKFVQIKDRIKNLEMKTEKPKLGKIHIDLKRSSSIARMSSEKISPTSARRRYEKRTVIIRSKSRDEVVPSPTGNKAIKEIEKETKSEESIEKKDNAPVVAETKLEASNIQSVNKSSQEPKEESALDRQISKQRSKSEGGQEQKISYKETYQESTREDAIQKVLDQAYGGLLKSPLAESKAQPKKFPQFPEGAQGSSATGSSAQGTNQKRKSNHGKSHPLAKLKSSARNNPFYSTM